jgi:hypothetical protein
MSVQTPTLLLNVYFNTDLQIGTKTCRELILHSRIQNWQYEEDKTVTAIEVS